MLGLTSARRRGRSKMNKRQTTKLIIEVWCTKGKKIKWSNKYGRFIPDFKCTVDKDELYQCSEDPATFSCKYFRMKQSRSKSVFRKGAKHD